MMHTWGEDDFDWLGIDCAAQYIGENLRKWGRVDVRQYKEKFGEVRVYCSLGLYMWHQLIWPGYVSNQYPWHWLWTRDVYFPQWIFRLVNRLVVPYHKWLYRVLYGEAVRVYPHLHDEILDAADYPELLKGL